MGTGRMEAFSDGVLAIILTIMVLDIKVPHGVDWAAVQSLLPVLGYYLLSFIYVGIYWNNHHHLLQGADKINGAALWANLHLLFWLSLIPFVTRWMGESEVARIPVICYGVVLLMSGVAYYLLVQSLIAADRGDSILAQAIGSDFKGIISVVFYALAIAAAFISPWISLVLFVVVAGIWLVPDRRIEEKIDHPPVAQRNVTHLP